MSPEHWEARYGERGGRFPLYRGAYAGPRRHAYPRSGRRSVTVACPAMTGVDTQCEADVTVELRCETSREEDGLHTDIDIEEWEAPCGHPLTHESEQDSLIAQAKDALKDDE